MIDEIKKKFTRAQLYDYVWRQPMITAARQVGITDRGLSKICRKHHIPVPGLGYWAKKQAGHNVKQVSLLELKLHNPDQIIFIARSPRMEANKYSETVEMAVLFEQEKQNRLIVNSNAELTNKMAIQLQRSLTGKSDKEGVMKGKRGYMNCFKVTSGQAYRALGILDVLLSTFVRRDFGVIFSSGYKLKVNVFEEIFSVVLDEKFEYELTEERGGQYWKAIPTGRLRVRFESEYMSRTFYDTVKHPRLERSINTIMIFLYKASDDNKRLRNIAQEEARQREEEHKRREEIWRAMQVEQRRIKGIDLAVSDWLRIEQIQRFIDQVKNSMPLFNLSSEQREYCLMVVEWAEKYVKTNHPVQILVSHQSRFV